MKEMDKSRELYSREGDNSSRFEGKTMPWENTVRRKKNLSQMCSFDYTAVAAIGKLGPINWLTTPFWLLHLTVLSRSYCKCVFLVTRTFTWYQIFYLVTLTFLFDLLLINVNFSLALKEEER